jgi:hypothetical protein
MRQRRLIGVAFVVYVLAWASLAALIGYVLLERTVHAMP